MEGTTTRQEAEAQRVEISQLLEEEAHVKVNRHEANCCDSNSPENRMMSRMIRAMRIAGIPNATILMVMGDEARIAAADRARYGR